MLALCMGTTAASVARQACALLPSLLLGALRLVGRCVNWQQIVNIVEVAAARAAPYAAEHVDALLEDCKEHYAEAYEASYGANRERAREARRARLAHRAGMAALRAFFALGDDAGESAQAAVEAYLKDRIIDLLDETIHVEIKPQVRAQVVKRLWWVACVPCARCALVSALERMLVVAVNDVVALEIDEAFAFIVEKKRQRMSEAVGAGAGDAAAELTRALRRYRLTDDVECKEQREPPSPSDAPAPPARSLLLCRRVDLDRDDVDVDLLRACAELDVPGNDLDVQCACFDVPHAGGVASRGDLAEDEESEPDSPSILLEDPEAVVTTYRCESAVVVISNPDGRAALVF